MRCPVGPSSWHCLVPWLCRTLGVSIVHYGRDGHLRRGYRSRSFCRGCFLSFRILCLRICFSHCCQVQSRLYTLVSSVSCCARRLFANSKSVFSQAMIKSPTWRWHHGAADSIPLLRRGIAGGARRYYLALSHFVQMTWRLRFAKGLRALKSRGSS